MTPARAFVLATGLACVALVAAAYRSVLAMPHFAEWYIEHQVACGQGFRPEELWLRRGPYYRPAGYWTNQLVCALGGREPRPVRDHALWLGVHLACVGLVFAVLRERCGAAAAAAAALGFGLHPSLTPVVVYPVPWMALVGLLLLLAVAVYAPIARSASPPAWTRSILGGSVVLLAALVCEPGVCAAAAVAGGLAIEGWRRRDARWAVRAVGPAALALVSYGVLRTVAMGPSFFDSYVGPPPTWRALVWVWARNAVYEAAVWANPVRLPFADRSADDRAILAVYGAVFLGTLAGALAFGPIRRYLADHPLPVVGLAFYVLLQMNSNWLVVKEPIGRAGIDRSYLQYLPVLLLALLAGPGLGRAAAAAGPWARAALMVAVTTWLAAAFVAQQNALALAEEGGRILRADQTALTPFLRTLPEGATVVPCGFPEALRAPHLPWAWIYFFSREAIFSEWAGRHILVPRPLGDHPAPPGFDGYVVIRDHNGIRWFDGSAHGAFDVSGPCATWTRP